MLLYSICTVPVLAGIDMYLRNSHEYTQEHDQYQCIAMSHDSYVP